MSVRGVTLADALDSAITALRAAKVDTPRLDAELLLAEALRADRVTLIVDSGRELDRDASRAFQALVRRRAIEREPIAYLLGRREFRRLTLAVDPRVLIPRPETEHLVEAALDLPDGARVVDVGTGSGAVALALADERPDLEVLAVDLDAGAVACARENAARLGLDVEVRRSDLLASVPEPLDAVVANLPYVPAGATLPPEVAAHEPARALRAGADGGDVLRRLIPDAVARAPFVALEVSPEQAGWVADALRAAGATDTEVRRDLAGRERVVIGRR